MMKKYDAYKDSGVKWIGEIPEHWEITPLKFCFKVLSGATPKSTELSYWEDGNINWITPADFKTEDRFISDGAKKITKEGFMSCSTTLIPSGSIIFSKRAPIGSVVINSNEVCTNQGCLSCIPKDDISSLFFYYIMSVSQKYFDMLGTGTTFNEISANVFKNVHLPVPPLSEQQAIASYLDAKTEKIDKMIAKAEKKIENLDKLKQSLITRAVTRGLNPNVKMLKIQGLWVSHAPSHWKVLRLKHIASMRSGDNLTSLDIKDKGNYIVYGGNGQRGYYDDYNCDGQHVLIGRQGALAGNIHLVNGRFWATDHAVVTYIKGNNNISHFAYLLEAMHLNQYAYETSAQPGLAVSKISNLKTVLPPLTEQQQIATYLDTKCSKIDHIIATQKKKIAYLQELKQSLITNVVTGKIKVS